MIAAVFGLEEILKDLDVVNLKMQKKSRNMLKNKLHLAATQIKDKQLSTKPLLLLMKSRNSKNFWI